MNARPVKSLPVTYGLVVTV